VRLTLLTFLIFSTIAQGKSLRVPYQGVRPLGMGNAFVALADDSNLLWYNPAGLARVKGFHFNLIDLQLGADSRDTLDRMNNFIFKDDSRNLLRSDTQSMRVGSRPTFMMPYFGWAFYENFNSFTDLQNIDSITAPLDASVDINLFNDAGFILGLGIPASKYFSIGVSGRIFQRNAVDTHLTAQDLLSELSVTQTDFREAIFNHVEDLIGVGYAVGINGGVLAEIPLPKDYPTVTLAATAEDIGQTTFRKMGDLPLPKAIRPSYHFGAALQYKLNTLSNLNFALDHRNFGESLPWFKKWHFGTEYRHKYFALRAGVNDAYLTFGASIEFPPHTRLHIATYQTELDDYSFLTRGQRWYVMQLTIGFNPF